MEMVQTAIIFICGILSVVWSARQSPTPDALKGDAK